MRIERLQVQNFKAIKSVDLSDLSSLVVVAGPNGSGKSTLFDAIRLVKSVYGGYQPNEWQQWFSEFQIKLDTSKPEISSLLHDKQKPLLIALEIKLSEAVKAYIEEEAENLLRPITWREYNGGDAGSISFRTRTPIATRLTKFGQTVERDIKQNAIKLRKELKAKTIVGEIVMSPTSEPTTRVKPSLLLELLYSSFDPQNLGIIDYHGSQRTYQREMVGGINLNIQTTEQKASQHALYNWAAKYTNIKEEVAAQLVREILAEKAGWDCAPGTTLLESLRELFERFFPGKNFNGPEPTISGGLRFPVITDDGVEHDINDLSSGEKEVLYGYLRLHNLAPQHSVLLIDEPEMHLNPRLVQGLPQFYQKHLGKSSDNQIWLLTHSDSLLREALVTDDSSVYHMLQPDTIKQGENQIRRLSAEEEVSKAIIDLVGDLAAFKPGAKIVIVEGGGQSDFDVYMLSQLFPEFAKKVNLLSGGSKHAVKALHETLDRAKIAGALPIEIYSIVDNDWGDEVISEHVTVARWNAYHIENYLLVPERISSVLIDLDANKASLSSASDVDYALKECAEAVLNRLALKFLQDYANKPLVSSVKTRIDPNSTRPVADITEAIQASQERFNSAVHELTEEKLKTQYTDRVAQFKETIADNTWKLTFPGREVLAEFSRKHHNVSNEQFMNLIVAKMRECQDQPEAIKNVLNKIVQI